MELEYRLIYFATAYLNAAMGLSMFFHRTRTAVVQAYLAFVVAITGWIVTLFLFYSLTDATYVLLYGRLNFVFSQLLLFFMFVFIYLFPRKVMILSKHTWAAMIVWTAVVTCLSGLTDFVDSNEIVLGADRITEFGPLFWMHFVHIIFFFLASLALLVQKLAILREKEALQVRSLAIGWGISALLAIITNLVLPFLVGNYDFQHIGPAATLFLVLATAYAIARHEMLDVKMVATEQFTICILFISFINIAIASSTFQVIMAIMSLVAGLIIGIALIDSVRKAHKRSLELVQLSRSLTAANNKLEKRDQMRSEFISIASHQLRTPVSVMKGYLSLMLDGNYGRVSQKIQDKIRQMYEMNERLVLLINNMLNMTRIEKNKIEFGSKELRIDEVAAAVVEEMSYKAEKRGLELRLASYAGKMPIVYSDEEKIREILINLIDNAIKYTQKGFIEISFDVDHPGRRVIVFVRDTGLGLTQEDAAGMFRKFHRVNNPNVPKESGAGLGLFIAARFLDGMGGKIWIEKTEPGAGSTFAFHVPFRPPEAQPDATAKSA